MYPIIKVTNIKPILKWAGGKRALLPELIKYIPDNFNKYYEPFLGGGALFFELQPISAVINDLNEEIINLYLIIKNDVYSLIEELKSYKNTIEFYYYIRNLDREPIFNLMDKVKRAARILYLNKTCFNGLFRVNSNNKFNVPFGFYKSPKILDIDNLLKINYFLNSFDISILNVDFEIALKNIQANDFVYFDPPYVPLNESSSFTSYTSNGFGKNDQIRLKELCDYLDSINVKFLLSNSSTPFIIDLYKNYKIEYIQAPRNINSVGTKRGKISELLIRNY